MLEQALDAEGLNGSPLRHLQAGETLVTRGESGGDAFWVVSGSLEVLDENDAALGLVGPGHLVGEYVALVGGERTATIRALEPTAVRPVTGERLEALLGRHPDIAGQVRAEASRRIHETRLREVLSAMLGPGSPEVADEIAERGTWRRLAAGEPLFTAGEKAESGFIVVSGRVHRLGTTEDGHDPGYLSAGSVVGEEGFAGGRRTVTVEAVRDTVVLEIGRDVFADVLVRYPRAVAPVALGLAGGVRPPRRQLDRTVAVATAAPMNARQVASRVAEHLQTLGSVSHLWSTRVDALLDRPGIAQAQHGDPGEIRLLDALAHVEHEHRYLVLEPDRDHTTPWSRRVFAQADVLAILVSASPDAQEQRRVDALVDSAGPRTVRVLVRVHPEDAEQPAGTAAVMDRWPVDRVLHMRAGSMADVRRVARLLVGRPVTLVLGGGGARGFASIGVFRAMVELKIPVDAVGGTSVGSPLGAGIAQGVGPSELESESERLFRNVLDYTLPVVSLLKGEQAASAVVRRFQGQQIEDLWLPYFCVSTNLTRGRAEIHDRGDIATAVRASSAIPGGYPPVPYGEDLLVDGGVTNNLPVDVMRRNHPNAEVVAVDVAPARGPRAKSDFGLSVSGWQAMKSKVGRGPAYPGLMTVLMRSMLTGSLNHRDTVVNEGMADLLLDISMRGVSLLEFDRVREVARMGYEDAKPRLEAWLTARADEGRAVPGVAADRP